LIARMWVPPTMWPIVRGGRLDRSARRDSKLAAEDDRTTAPPAPAEELSGAEPFMREDEELRAAGAGCDCRFFS